MSTRIVAVFDVLPVRIVGGADQCSNSCPKKPRGNSVCTLFGSLDRKPKTKQTYLRSKKCMTAEVLFELYPLTQGESR